MTTLGATVGHRFSATTLATTANESPIETDAELMQRLCQRDLAALEQLIDRHQSVALGVACRILRDRSLAEDVVQDAFFRLWQRPDRYDAERGSVRSWLLAIVHHCSVDRLRKMASASRMVELTPDIVDRASTDPVDAAVATVEREQVHAALATLPDEQRVAIELSFLHGRTHVEIAALMNIPLGTVKGRIRIGMEKLRAALAAPELAVA